MFTSGIQHIAETPEGMAKQPDFVRQYMSELPETWDDVKFIDGYPGKYVVMARKKGNTWYIAGINGENTEREVELNLPFIAKKTKAYIITDTKDAKGFVKENLDPSKPVRVKMLPCGGFVVKTL